MERTIFQSLSCFICLQRKYSFLLLLVKHRSIAISILYYWPLNNLLIQSLIIFQKTLFLRVLWWFSEKLPLASTLRTWVVKHHADVLVWILREIFIIIILTIISDIFIEESCLVLAVAHATWLIETLNLTSNTWADVWFHRSRFQMHHPVLVFLAHGHHHFMIWIICTDPLFSPEVFWCMFFPIFLWIGTWCTH